jgi:hypothetical protein
LFFEELSEYPLILQDDAFKFKSQSLVAMINDLRNPQTKRHYKSGDKVGEKNIREKEKKLWAIYIAWDNIDIAVP